MSIPGESLYQATGDSRERSGRPYGGAQGWRPYAPWRPTLVAERPRPRWQRLLVRLWLALWAKKAGRR